jgi:hypothetical protein
MQSKFSGKFTIRFRKKATGEFTAKFIGLNNLILFCCVIRWFEH